MNGRRYNDPDKWIFHDLVQITPNVTKDMRLSGHNSIDRLSLLVLGLVILQSQSSPVWNEVLRH